MADKEKKSDIPSAYPEMTYELKTGPITSDTIAAIMNQRFGYLKLARQNGKTTLIHNWIEQNLKENNDMFWNKKNPYLAALAEAKLGDQQVIVTPEFKPEPEEWIWVEGYKGTQADMTCNGYQYIMNQQHNMAEGAEIEECRSGFHLCKYLVHVFNYYKIGNGHRFFKVKALVRKEDYDAYGARTSLWGIGGKDKLVAKSIIFEREMTVDEIFDGFEGMEDWSQEDKLLALEQSITFVEHRNMTNELVKLGYSEVFAAYCASHNKYDKAYALGTQEGLSMDMKIFAIMVED